MPRDEVEGVEPAQGEEEDAGACESYARWEEGRKLIVLCCSMGGRWI